MKIKRLKICSLAALFLLLFCFMFCGLKSNAATSNEYTPTGDLGRYDLIDSEGNAPYWAWYKNWWFGTKWKTGIFLRIVDKDGKFIDDLVEIEATYYVGEKFYHVHEKNTFNTSGRFSFGKIDSDYGEFSPIYYSGVKEEDLIEKFKDTDHPFEKCNYRWDFNHKIVKFETLYVWYEDSNGEIKGTSMYKDGAHPKYDSSGNFLGIYDSNNNLMNGYSLSEKGKLVTPEKLEVDLWERQKQGEYVEVVTNPIKGIFENASDRIVGVITAITSIAAVIVLILIIIGLIKLITLFNNLVKKKG